MKEFKVGDQVELKNECFEAYPGLKKYDLIFYSEYGTVVHVTNDLKGVFPQSCMVSFGEDEDKDIIDIPSTYLKEFGLFG